MKVLFFVRTWYVACRGGRGGGGGSIRDIHYISYIFRLPFGRLSCLSFFAIFKRPIRRFFQTAHVFSILRRSVFLDEARSFYVGVKQCEQSL
jgi:hypothetical protein